MTPPSRIRARDVARLTGLSLRMVQRRAAAGDIPGAAQLCGIWTFDPQAVQRWVQQGEREICLRTKAQKISIRSRRQESGISELWSTVASLEEAFKQSLKL